MATTYKTEDGNGSKLIFTYPFPVLKTEDVQVALNGGVQATTKYTVSLSPAQITFNNTSINNTLQESTGAPKSGVEVRVFRNTEVDNPKGVFAAGNSVRAADLNANVDQALYALQEEKDQPLWDVAFEGGTIDGVTIGGTTPAAGTFSNLTISNLDGTIIGANTAAAGTFTTGTIATADINGGNIDGTIIGANTAAAGTFTSLNTTGNVALGNTNSDQITLTGCISDNITPCTGSIDIGTSSAPFDNLHLNGTAYVNEISLVDDKKLKFGDATDDDAELYYSGNVFYIDSEKGIILDTGNGSFSVAINGTTKLAYLNSTGYVAGNWLPFANDAHSLGSDAYKWRDLKLTGTAYLPNVDIDAGNIDGTTIGANSAAAGTFTTGSFNDITLTDSSVCNINTNTSDGSDNKVLVIGGGGDGNALRGGFAAFYGNESGSTGNVQLGSGRTSTGKVEIYAGPTPTLGLTIDQDGKAVIPTADINGGAIDGTTIGATTPVAGTFTTLNLSGTTGQISSNTSDGSDIKNIHLCGGGGTNNARGATISLSGNEATNAGNLYLYSGAVTTGEVFIYAGDSSTLGLKVNQHGNVVIPTDLTVQGTLNVTGSTTTINTSTLEVEDKNITLAKVSTPTDTTADGGGITIKGATDKTFNWVDATDSFTSSEHIHLNGDNRKLRFGAASDDVEVYYTGTAFNIDSAGTIVLDTHSGAFSVACQGTTKLGWASQAGGVIVGDDIVPFGTGQSGQHDIGSSTLQFKDIYIDGVAYLDEVDIDAGAIDGTTIGANTPAAGDFTRVVLTGAPGKLVSNTSSGSDNNIVAICAGGDSATSRGGLVSLYGNDAASNPGDVIIYSGAVSTGKIKFHTGSPSTLGLTIDENQNTILKVTSQSMASEGNLKIEANADGADIGGGITFGNSTARRAAIIGKQEGATGSGNNKGYLAFGTRGSSGDISERLKITSGGEVGINVTPSNGQMLAITGRSGYDDIVQVTAVGDNMGPRINLTSTGNGVARINATNNTLSLQRGGTSGITIDANNAVQLYYDGAGPKFETKSDGGKVSGKLYVEDDGTYLKSNQLQFHSSGSAYIDHITTGQSVIFRTSASSALDTTALTIASTGNTTFSGTVQANQFALLDNKKATFGDSNDLSIWHGESNSGNGENTNYISSASGRNIVLQVQDDANSIIFHKRTGTGLLNFEVLASFTAGGSNAFYYDSTKRFETTSYGNSVFGHFDIATDGDKLRMGGSYDLSLWHDGNNATIKNDTGWLNLYAGGSGLTIGNGDFSKNFLTARNDTGAVQLYFDGAGPKFETTSAGATVTGDLLVSAGVKATTTFAGDNNVKLKLGESDDLLIYHSGAHNLIECSNGMQLHINKGDTENMAKFIPDGAVELYHGMGGSTAAAKKFETTTAGITVTGAVTETSDIALKTNIEPIDNVLEKIKQITGYTYQFKDTGHDSIGVTAQDVEKVFPELVHGEEGSKTLQYSGLIGALIESVKELSAKVAKLEAG